MTRSAKKDVREVIREWLSDSGYPLELYVGRQFGQAGFRIAHSTHYPDPLTGLMREVDLLATFQKVGVHKETARSFTVTITFIVECKKSEKHPWVVFLPAREDQKSSPDGAHSIFTWPMNATAKAELATRLATSWSTKQTIYAGINHGHSIVTALGKESLGAYQAIQQALGGTAARLDQIGKAGAPNRAQVVLPVVVLDGLLFEAQLDDAYSLAVREVSQSVLVLQNQTGGLEEPRISIVTRQAVPDFVRVAVEMAKSIAGTADAIAGQVAHRPH